MDLSTKFNILALNMKSNIRFYNIEVLNIIIIIIYD